MIYQGPTREQNREIFEKMENKAEAMWPCKLCLRPWQDHMMLTKWCPLGGAVTKVEWNKQVYAEVSPVQSFVPMDNFEFVEFKRRAL